MKNLREKLKPLETRLKPITSKMEQLSPRKRRYILQSMVVFLAFVIGLIIGCESGSGPKHRFLQQDLGITETIDSFIAVIPEGSHVIARFNDERHSLYYLKDGHLMRFNAQSKMLEEVTPENTNANLEIYYSDNDEKSGIIAAQLSKDEKFILFTAVIRRRSQEDEPLKTQNYQLNTESLNMLAYDGKALDPIPVKKDTVKVKKQEVKTETQSESQEDANALNTNTENASAPAAETHHEESKTTEPKATEPKSEVSTAKEHEHTAAPVE